MLTLPEIMIEDRKKVALIMVDGTCDLKCSQCPINNLCHSMPDASKKDAAKIWLNK